MSRLMELSGRRFGLWTVLRRSERAAAPLGVTPSAIWQAMHRSGLSAQSAVDALASRRRRA